MTASDSDVGRRGVGDFGRGGRGHMDRELWERRLKKEIFLCASGECVNLHIVIPGQRYEDILRGVNEWITGWDSD